MNKNWNVHINKDGDLLIQGRKGDTGLVNLFGTKEVEYGICIYSHYLRSVRQVLSALFPNSGIRSLEAIEATIKQEFCESRSVNIFKSILDKADIPYRSYSHVNVA